MRGDGTARGAAGTMCDGTDDEPASNYAFRAGNNVVRARANAVRASTNGVCGDALVCGGPFCRACELICGAIQADIPLIINGLSAYGSGSLAPGLPQSCHLSAKGFDVGSAVDPLGGDTPLGTQFLKVISKGQAPVLYLGASFHPGRCPIRSCFRSRRTQSPSESASRIRLAPVWRFRPKRPR